jgi:hypothetical protein
VTTAWTKASDGALVGQKIVFERIRAQVVDDSMDRAKSSEIRIEVEGRACAPGLEPNDDGISDKCEHLDELPPSLNRDGEAIAAEMRNAL